MKESFNTSKEGAELQLGKAKEKKSERGRIITVKMAEKDIQKHFYITCT